MDTVEPTPISNISLSQSTHRKLRGASLVCFFDIRLGSVEAVETITKEVDPERESNLRPPALDSLKHGFANVHMVHVA